MTELKLMSPEARMKKVWIKTRTQVELCFELRKATNFKEE